MNDNPKQTNADDEQFGTDLREALGGLMEFLQDHLTQETDRKEIAVDKIRSWPVRERQLVQEAATVGYMLGWTDYHERQQPTEDSIQITARVVDRALQEPEQFFAMATDAGEPDGLADQLNQRLTRELDATKRAKQEIQLERDQARLELRELQEKVARGEASDGHHTHEELYRYRMLYNAHAVEGWLAAGIRVVKSKRHHDGDPCFGGGWFIVTAELPSGQISNHYRLENWDLFNVPELEVAPEWDGHSPEDAAYRMQDALS